MSGARWEVDYSVPDWTPPERARLVELAEKYGISTAEVAAFGVDGLKPRRRPQRRRGRRHLEVIPS